MTSVTTAFEIFIGGSGGPFVIFVSVEFSWMKSADARPVSPARVFRRQTGFFIDKQIGALLTVFARILIERQMNPNSRTYFWIYTRPWADHGTVFFFSLADPPSFLFPAAVVIFVVSCYSFFFYFIGYT